MSLHNHTLMFPPTPERYHPTPADILAAIEDEITARRDPDTGMLHDSEARAAAREATARVCEIYEAMK